MKLLTLLSVKKTSLVFDFEFKTFITFHESAAAIRASNLALRNLIPVQGTPRRFVFACLKCRTVIFMQTTPVTRPICWTEMAARPAGSRITDTHLFRTPACLLAGEALRSVKHCPSAARLRTASFVSGENSFGRDTFGFSHSRRFSLPSS